MTQSELLVQSKIREKPVNFKNRSHSNPAIDSLLVTLIFLVLVPSAAFPQQKNMQTVGLPTDWTHKHVIFSNPGTFEQATQGENRVNWYGIVNDLRYQLQQARRTTRMRQGEDSSPVVFIASRGENQTEAAAPEETFDGAVAQTKRKMHKDWTVALAGGSNYGVAPDTYPAKYSFSLSGTPNCTTDYVVFPINAPGASNQANLLGVNNLYGSPTCSGTVPKVVAKPIRRWR